MIVIQTLNKRDRKVNLCFVSSELINQISSKGITVNLYQIRWLADENFLFSFSKHPGCVDMYNSTSSRWKIYHYDAL